MLRERDRAAHRNRDRIAHPSLLRPLEAFENFLRTIPWQRENHLGVLRHSEDAIAVAGQYDLRLSGHHGLDDDFRAVKPPAGGALDSAPALE